MDPFDDNTKIKICTLEKKAIEKQLDVLRKQWKELKEKLNPITLHESALRDEKLKIMAERLDLRGMQLTHCHRADKQKNNMKIEQLSEQIENMESELTMLEREYHKYDNVRIPLLNKIQELSIQHEKKEEELKQMHIDKRYNDLLKQLQESNKSKNEILSQVQKRYQQYDKEIQDLKDTIAQKDAELKDRGRSYLFKEIQELGENRYQPARNEQDMENALLHKKLSELDMLYKQVSQTNNLLKKQLDEKINALKILERKNLEFQLKIRAFQNQDQPLPQNNKRLDKDEHKALNKKRRLSKKL